MSDIKLMQGDCLELMRDLPDNSVDAVITDPPYGHNNNNNGDLISRREAALGKGDYIPKRDNRPIANDGVEANELFRAILPELYRVLKPGCCCCCCGGGGGPDPQFARWSLWIDEVFEFVQMVVWDKGKIGMGWKYRRSYEVILVAKKPGAKIAWYDNSHKIENIIRPGDYGIKKIIPSAKQHPTEKPVKLVEHFARLHTQPGDTIIDPFMGGGTTGVACVQLGRNFIGMEIDKKYYAMAEKRINEAQMRRELLDQ